MVGYQQMKLFVKPSSSFPYSNINSYFVNYLNKKQAETEDYIIGDLFNARDNELWALFSDKTREGHNMTVNYINILQKQEIAMLDDLKALEAISETQLNKVTQQAVNVIKDTISVQQLYNDIKSSIQTDLQQKEPQMIQACGLFLAQHLVSNQDFLTLVASEIAKNMGQK